MQLKWAALVGTALLLCSLGAWAQDIMPDGSEFQVNTYTTGSQTGAVGSFMGLDADGDFVVVWRSLGQDGSS